MRQCSHGVVIGQCNFCLAEALRGEMEQLHSLRTLPHKPGPNFVSLADLLVWLDSVRRAYGDDVPLFFEDISLKDAHLEGSGDTRRIVFYARTKGWNI